MLLRQRVSDGLRRAADMVRDLRDSELGHSAGSFVNAAGSRPLLVACIFALGLVGLISIGSALNSMGARTQGLRATKVTPGHKLIDAAFAGDISTVRAILKEGRLTVNYQDARGRTPLMAASEGARHERASALACVRACALACVCVCVCVCVVLLTNIINM